MTGTYRTSFDDDAPGPEVQLLGGTDGTKIGNTPTGGLITGPELADTDAFNRPRTSLPVTLLEFNGFVGKDPAIWNEALISGGTSTHLQDRASIRLTTSTSNGSSVIRETYRRAPYFQGKSQLVEITGNFDDGDAASGVIRRYGYFTSSDGVFIERENGITYAVVRSSASGEVVDTRTAMSSWNQDTFDGNGASGISLDFSKQISFILDISWMGSGIVRFGTYSQGRRVFGHVHFLPSAVPLMRGATLPLRAEIVNTTAQGVPRNLYMTCGAVISEGGDPMGGRMFTLDNGTASVNITTTPTLLLGMRLTPGANLVSATPQKMTFLPTDGTAVVRWSLLLNPTISGVSWSNVTDTVQSCTVGGTGVSGGTVIASGYVDLGQSGSLLASVTRDEGQFRLENDSYLGYDLSGNPTNIALVARTLSSTGSLLSTLRFREFK